VDFVEGGEVEEENFGGWGAGWEKCIAELVEVRNGEEFFEVWGSKSGR